MLYVTRGPRHVRSRRPSNSRIWLCDASRAFRQATAIWTPRKTPHQYTGTAIIGISRPKGVSDGTRTRGRRDHNPELYQLSYAHHETAGPI